MVHVRLATRGGWGRRSQPIDIINDIIGTSHAL